MESTRPPSFAIFFLDLFFAEPGDHGPLDPFDGSATESTFQFNLTPVILENKFYGSKFETLFYLDG